MGWYYVPSVSAPESADVNSDSGNWAFAPFVMLNGIASPRPSSWHRWKARPWIARLSPTISNPSMAERGVESWISSLRDFPVSLSPSVAAVPAPTIHDGFGPSSSESSMRYDPGTSSWKMSQASFLSEQISSSVVLPGSGSMRSGHVYPRRRLARATNGTAGSAWPTVQAVERRNGLANPRTVKSRENDSRITLTERVAAWATSMSRDWKGLGEYKDTLTTDVARWNTPRTTPRVVSELLRQPGRRDLKVPSGDASLKISPILNPLFVEWLMGFPITWTDCAVSVTPSFRPRRQSRSKS